MRGSSTLFHDSDITALVIIFFKAAYGSTVTRGRSVGVEGIHNHMHGVSGIDKPCQKIHLLVTYEFALNSDKSWFVLHATRSVLGLLIP